MFSSNTNIYIHAIYVIIVKYFDRIANKKKIPFAEMIIFIFFLTNIFVQ